jgi:dihydroorotate dehydrogenase electron transfer subunit
LLKMKRHEQSSRQPSSIIEVKRPGRGQFVCTVAANIPLCREHYRLVLSLPWFPESRPGQFIQISCRDLHEDFAREQEWDLSDCRHAPEHGAELLGPLALLRRPFSLAGRRDTSGGVELDIIHRVVGVGTDWMAHLKADDEVFILGPLGNQFQLPAAGGQAILVGGGVGIPPMIYLAEALAGRKAVAFSGALSRDLLPLTIRGTPSSGDSIEAEPVIEEFSRHGIPSIITTDDGSFGFRGFVTQALDKYLANAGPAALDVSGTPGPTIYTCGPEPMMKRVGEIAAARGIGCQIAVERAMACGMGTCQSCCIRVRKADPSKPPLVGRDWCYRLACTDGPVFRGADLLW